MRPRLSSHPWPWHALWTPHPAIKTRGSEERSTDWGFRKEMGGQRAKQTGLDIYGASANELSFEKNYLFDSYKRSLLDCTTWGRGNLSMCRAVEIDSSRSFIFESRGWQRVARGPNLTLPIFLYSS